MDVMEDGLILLINILHPMELKLMLNILMLKLVTLPLNLVTMILQKLYGITKELLLFLPTTLKLC